MKATGEVMAIDRSFEAALMKAIRSLEVGIYGLSNKTGSQMSDMQLEEAIRIPNDERLWAITEAFRRGMLIEEVNALCNVDPWFLRHLQRLVGIETRLRVNGRAIARIAEKGTTEDTENTEENENRLVVGLLREAKRAGFADRTIAEFAEIPEMKTACFAKASWHCPNLQNGGYVRGRVRGRNALFLLLL